MIDYKGRKTYFHGGQITGFNSIVAQFPQEKLGYSILTNSHHTVLHAVLMFTIADPFLGGKQTDWSAGLMQLMQYASQQTKEGVKAKQEARQADIKPALPLEDYCGTYEQDFIGPTTVELREGSLYMSYGTNHQGELVHWEKDTFYANWEDKTFDWTFVDFNLSEDKTVKGLTIPGEGFFEKK